MTAIRKSLSLLVVVAGLLLGALALTTPSYAAAQVAVPRVSDQACTDDSGVSVVVDATGVEGDVTQACVPATGEEPATDVLEQAGVQLAYVAGQPGFVCTVDDLPADQDCSTTPSGTSYWGLFVTGEDGSWGYAPVGVGDLRLSPGDAVGFAWQTSSEPTVPGVDPAASAAGSESAEPQPNDGATIPSTPGTDAEVAADDGAGDGAPVWIFYVVVVVVAVGGLVVVQLRRRSRK